MLIGGTDDCHASVSAVSLRRLTSLLVAILLALAVTACGTLSAPETPANQRFGYVFSAAEISWDASPDADSYSIYFGDADCRLESGRTVNCEELESDIEDTYYLHHNHRNETGDYWVVACNRFSCSEIDTANPALPLPPAPDILGIEQVGSSLRITWSPVPGATHYKVYHNQEIGRCTPSYSYHPQCKELVGNVTGTAYSHAISAPEGIFGIQVVDRTSDSLTINWPERYHGHYYWVAACTSVGCSAINTDYTPEEFVASHEVLPAYYLIYREPEGQTAQEFRYVPTGSSPDHFQYVDKGLQASTIYYHRVKACNESGCSEESGESAGLTEGQGPVDPPSTPTGFHAEKVAKREAGDDARVFWVPVEGATYYEIWQGSNPSRPFAIDKEISAPRLPTCGGQGDFSGACYYDRFPNRSDFGFSFSTTSYRVRACNKAGCSAFTETVTLD